MINPIAYLAHPYGGKEINLWAAKAWLGYLILAVPDVDFCAPWIPWVEVLRTDEHRKRGMAFDLEVVRRCDQVWLCGPGISAGMELERAAARVHDKPIIDLTGLVLHPTQHDFILETINRKRFKA